MTSTYSSIPAILSTTVPCMPGTHFHTTETWHDNSRSCLVSWWPLSLCHLWIGPVYCWLSRAGVASQGWCPKYVFSYCTSVNAMALIINLDVMLHWKTCMFLMPTILLTKRLIFLSIVSILMLSGVNLVYEVMLWYGHIYIFVNIWFKLLQPFTPIFMNSCCQIYSTS